MVPWLCLMVQGALLSTAIGAHWNAGLVAWCAVNFVICLVVVIRAEF